MKDIEINEQIDDVKNRVFKLEMLAELLKLEKKLKEEIKKLK